MRLNQQQRQQAAEELLQMLARYPQGLSTREMVGTPQFHGETTLSHRQIARVLRETGKVGERVGGYGMRTYTVWRLR